MLKIKSLERNSQWQSMFWCTSNYTISWGRITSLFESSETQLRVCLLICMQKYQNDIGKKIWKEGLSKILGKIGTAKLEKSWIQRKYHPGVQEWHGTCSGMIKPSNDELWSIIKSTGTDPECWLCHFLEAWI